MANCFRRFAAPLTLHPRDPAATMIGMSIEPHTADQQGPPETSPPSRTVRMLTSWKLWTVLLVLGVLGIGVSLTMPIVHRLQALAYFDLHKDIEYELSPEHEDWPERFGDWVNALREVESVSSMDATDELLLHVAALREVRSLELRESTSQPITEQGVANLQRFDRLRELKLSGGGFTDDAIAGLLQARPPLERVVFIDTGAARSSMLAMSRIPSIVEVVLLAESLGDDSFRDLAPLSNLKEFNVTGGGNECLEWLASCPQLEDAAFAFGQFTDEGLRHLSACQKLRWLFLGGGSITNAGLGCFAAPPALEELGLADCPSLTAEGIAQFPDMPNLRLLRLPAGLFSVDGIARLKMLPQLEHLTVYGSITDAELRSRMNEELSFHEEESFSAELLWLLVRRAFDAW